MNERDLEEAAFSEVFPDDEFAGIPPEEARAMDRYPITDPAHVDWALMRWHRWEKAITDAQESLKARVWMMQRTTDDYIENLEAKKREIASRLRMGAEIAGVTERRKRKDGKHAEVVALRSAEGKVELVPEETWDWIEDDAAIVAWAREEGLTEAVKVKATADKKLIRDYLTDTGADCPVVVRDMVPTLKIDGRKAQ